MKNLIKNTEINAPIKDIENGFLTYTYRVEDTKGNYYYINYSNLFTLIRDLKPTIKNETLTITSQNERSWKGGKLTKKGFTSL